MCILCIDFSVKMSSSIKKVKQSGQFYRTLKIKRDNLQRNVRNFQKQFCVESVVAQSLQCEERNVQEPEHPDLVIDDTITDSMEQTLDDGIYYLYCISFNK